MTHKQTNQNPPGQSSVPSLHEHPQLVFLPPVDVMSRTGGEDGPWRSRRLTDDPLQSQHNCTAHTQYTHWQVSQWGTSWIVAAELLEFTNYTGHWSLLCLMMSSNGVTASHLCFVHDCKVFVATGLFIFYFLIYFWSDASVISQFGINEVESDPLPTRFGSLRPSTKEVPKWSQQLA